MKIESFLLPEHDWVPNNPRLPVIIYRGAVEAESCEETAKAFEAAFAENGWPPQWRDGVYDYHHYHSTAHEALGVAAGSATLTIGGPSGPEIQVEAGDALFFPLAPAIAASRRAMISSWSVRIRRDRTGILSGKRRATRRGSVWPLCRFPTQILSRAPPGLLPNCGNNVVVATA